MADIQVHCVNCGTIFDVPDEAAGLIAQCPQCQQEVRVPLPSGGASGVGKLQVKRDHILAGGKKCPACDATMGEGAVICIHCGYDTRTGLRLETDNPRARVFQMVAKVLGVAVVVAGLWTAVRWYTSRDMKLPEVQAAPAPVKVRSSEPKPEVADPAAPTSVVAGLVVTQTVVTTQAQVSAKGSVTNMTPEELALMEARYRESVTGQLGQYYSFHAVGSTVTIRRITGLVHRGTIKEYKKESVLVDSEGSIVEVPLVALDQNSRLRCDAAFRAQFIAYQVRKRMQNVDRL